MDFIVSKVAMSICALLVVSVLGGVIGDDMLFDKPDELRSTLANLTIVLERVAWSNCEGWTVWRVPFLSNGDCIDISIRPSALRAHSEGRSVMTVPACAVHTWTWNGTSLNRTMMEDLDESSPTLESSSGHDIRIETKTVRYENGDLLLLFVTSGDYRLLETLADSSCIVSVNILASSLVL